MPASENLKECYRAYLQNPTADSFAALRALYLEAPDFNPYSRELEKAEQFVSVEDFDGLIDLIGKNLYPNHLLSPGAHFYLGLAFEKKGETEKSATEIQVGALLMDGMVSTGKGTETQPFHVTRTSDEYDFLTAHNLVAEGQALRELGSGRQCDVIQVKGGQTIWFDVTDIQNILKQKLRSKPNRKK